MAENVVDLVGALAVLDVEFLLKPQGGLRLVYAYRSGWLRLPMIRAVEQLAKAQGLPIIQHAGRDFVGGLSGLFEGLHLTDLGGMRANDQEQVLQAMRAFDGPTAVFLPVIRDWSSSESWHQLRAGAVVVEEAQPDAGTINAIVRYAAAVSDLSPPPSLLSDQSVRSHFLDRLPQFESVGDVFQDFDDFLLTGYGRSAPLLPGPQLGVREVALTRAVRSFLATAGLAEERKLLEQALLRGDDEKLVLGAVTAATITLLGQYRRQARPTLGEREKLCILWAVSLLAIHLGAGLLEGGYAPSWRSRPDVRPFLIAQLCRDQRRFTSDLALRDRLTESAAQALARLPVLTGGDEHAATKLSKAIAALVNAFEKPSRWCMELGQALEGGGKRTPPLALGLATRLQDIQQQSFAEHLRRRILNGAIDDPVLFHGDSSQDLEAVVFAWTSAVLCLTPQDGDACGSCESCLALSSRSSASVAVARFEIDASDNDDDERAKAAQAQVDEVRRLVVREGLWVGRKVVILDGVDRVRKLALDRLLKVMEEAPTLTTFVLVAERLRRVPAAFRSRSWALAVKPITPGCRRDGTQRQPDATASAGH